MIDSFLRSSSFEETPIGNVERFFIDNFLPQAKGRFFFECGAVNGFHLSQTATLESIHGWTGILVEAHKGFYDRLKKGSRKAKSVHAYVGRGDQVFFEEKTTGLLGHSQLRDDKQNENCHPVQTETIEEILTRTDAPEVIDYMVLDVEFAWRSAFDGIDFHKRRIDFLALEMKDRDEHVIATLYKNGFELVRVLQNEDYCFRRV